MKRAAFSLVILSAIGMAAEQDPNFPAVQAVCGRCHSTGLFQDKPRSWERWNDVFRDMTQRGATGTDEQLTRVTAYFLENLTIVNVNTGSAEEISGVLGVSDAVAAAIIAKRQQKPFLNPEELGAVPGVEAAVLKNRRSRILF